ncbi:hypothetical protein GCM10023214_00050 [Amycolatopsis dongchuanensis]|uniref:Uncharacterized protein n=1 Tax=Amycolatopsis dongchuanensis TaxID=1070866 RepID=A0ABP9PUP3_9PSEU
MGVAGLAWGSAPCTPHQPRHSRRLGEYFCPSPVGARHQDSACGRLGPRDRRPQPPPAPRPSPPATGPGYPRHRPATYAPQRNAPQQPHPAPEANTPPRPHSGTTLTPSPSG